jgi:hypothetical protein
MAHTGGDRHNPWVRTVGRLLAVVGLLAIISALAVLLWPLHTPGGGGNALAPRYHGFGWAGNSPTALPASPSRSELRSLGVVFPQDVVRQRREAAGALAVGGTAAVLGGAWLISRHRPTPKTQPAFA